MSKKYVSVLEDSAATPGYRIIAPEDYVYTENGTKKVKKIDSKADKKVPATAGNLATLDSTGNLADSGKQTTDFMNALTTAYEASGSATKTVTKVAQAKTGAVTVTYSDIQSGTTSQKGLVQLEDSTSSTSTTKAATPNSVKSAYDLANGKYSKPSGGIPSSDMDSTVQASLGKAETAIQGVKLNGSTLTPSSAKVVDLGNLKTKQTAVSDPSASGTTITAIATISQDANGVITATKKTIQSASQSQDGVMSAADKKKLDGISTGAEVNQNAFSNVKVGDVTVAADAKTDTLTLAAGSNVTITPDATNDKITIAAKDTTYTADAGIKLDGTVFKHTNSVSGGTVGPTTDTAGATLSVPYVTYDSQGHVTASGTRTHNVGTASTSGAGIVQLQDSIDATTTKAATPNAVKKAIEALDVSSVGGSGKYISAISESDGKISATATTMDTTPTASSENAVTSGGIKTALDGKQNTLPTTGTANDTYAINVSGKAYQLRSIEVKSPQSDKCWAKIAETTNNTTSDYHIAFSVHNDGYAVKSAYIGILSASIQQSNQGTAGRYAVYFYRADAVEFDAIKAVLVNTGTVLELWVCNKRASQYIYFTPLHSLRLSPVYGQDRVYTQDEFEAYISGKSYYPSVEKGINRSGTDAVGSNSIPVWVDANGTLTQCTDDFVHDGDVTVPSTVPTLAWNTESTLATIDGKNVKVKLPANPNSNTIPSAYCETAAGTAAKTATCTNYTATPNTYLHVLIRYTNTSAGALTLNVNGQGAKTIYINGSASSSSNYTLPAGTYIAFYDGTYYWIRTDGIIDAAISKSAAFADAVYNRAAMDGDGWFKIAESRLKSRTNTDITALWDVALSWGAGGIYYEKLFLDVRFGASGDGSVPRFVRMYDTDNSGNLKFAVVVSGTGGSGNTQVQLWAWLSKSWISVSVHQDAGNTWSLSTYNNGAWIYYTATTGGTTKPVADAVNHISVSDSANLHMRDASFINSGTFSVARGGTGMSTATYKNSVLIGNSTTVTNAMQTVRTGNGAFYATAQDAKPQFGTLPTAQGGTGKTSAEDACNAFINALSTGAAAPEDNDYYVAQYSGGGTTTTSYHRRPVSALWSYIKGKMTSDSAVNISGNAATASKLGMSNLGSDTKPIYLSSGTATECKAYAGGTAVTLNGTSAAASTASFYAPTWAGKHHRFLRSNGSGAPSWELPACDYVIQGNTWDSSHTKIIWAFRLKLENEWAGNNILFSFDTYFWNAQKSSSDLIYIGWSNQGNQGFSASVGRVRVGGNDNVSGNERPLKYYYVKNSAATASGCTLDIYIAPSVAGNSYGTFYVSVLNNSELDLDDIIEKKGTLNVALPDNAVEIPYTGIIGNAVTANDYNTSGGTIKTALDNKANKASVTAATKCKITYNSDGIVTAGGDLTAADIPVGNMYDNMNAFETNTTPWLCYEISGMKLNADYRSGTAEIIVYMYRTPGNTVHLSYKVSVNWNRTGANVEVEGTDIIGTWTAFIVNSATPASTDVTTLKLYFTPVGYTTYRLNLVSCKLRGSRDETIDGTIVKKTVQEAFPTESALVIKGTTVEKKLLNNGDVVSTYSGTGTAPVNGKAVKEAIDTKSPTSHTHSVKINGAEKTITATGGTAVDLGNYPDYVYFGNDSPIGAHSPADQCKTYFTSTAPSGKIRTGYNYNGDEYTLIFSKQAGGNYGNIIKYGYASRYIYILRYRNSAWQTDDWEKIAAGYADSAGSASKVANKLTLKIKTGTTEGTDLYTYDGSGAKTLDIKQGSNITLTAAAGSLTIAGTADTKNTAGSTDTSNKIFLIGATSQAANPQTYSQDTTYVDTDATLASTKVRVAEKCTLQFNTTTNALDFVFA